MELPAEDSLRWIVSRYARLRAAHGEAIGEPPLIEPNATFFPDPFAPTPEGVATLLRRTLSHAPVADDLPLELAFLTPDAEAAGGGCGSGACGDKGAALPLGNAVEVEDGYRVFVRVSDVGDPVLLTASLARSAGTIVLSEAGEAIDDDERDATSELAAVVCGFGLLLTNGACVYVKGCGGLRAHSGTRMTVEELTVALALFLRMHRIKPGLARGHMETTQREAFDEALRWVDGNEALVEALRSHPASLEDGLFAIEAPRGLLGKLFARKKAPAPPTEAELRAAASRPAKSEEELRRIAETKALVDEALRAR